MRSLQDHFLIAMPAMEDPNFNTTVTYLCKHDAEGALGVIINRPSETTLGDVLAQLSLTPSERARSRQPVLRGGPVEPERGFVLHRSAKKYDATLDPGGEIKVTLSTDILNAVARGEGPDPMIVALGYAGWDGGQLEAELLANAWLTVAADPAVIFDTPFEQRWAAAVGLLGVDIHQITSYAGHA
jgi:putative transcriptional regulator